MDSLNLNHFCQFCGKKIEPYPRHMEDFYQLTNNIKYIGLISTTRYTINQLPGIKEGYFDCEFCSRTIKFQDQCITHKGCQACDGLSYLHADFCGICGIEFESNVIDLSAYRH
jgi:hypothetical protein